MDCKLQYCNELFQNPKSAASVLNPKLVTSVQNPNSASVQNPKSVTEVQNPNSATSVQNPKSAASVLNPKLVASVQNPKSATRVKIPNHSKQHMAACGLSLHLGSSESRKTLEQKFIFQIGTLNPHNINDRFSFN